MNVAFVVGRMQSLASLSTTNISDRMSFQMLHKVDYVLCVFLKILNILNKTVIKQYF